MIMKGWVCTACNKKKCVTCHEAKDEDHVCREEDIATMKLIKGDSKPCPQCRAMIHRTEGCPQMFCVNCFTFFDYRNGDKLDPRRAHNPEHARAVREGRVNGSRNGSNDAYMLGNNASEIINWCREFHDYGLEVLQYNMKQFALTTLDLRIDFIKGYIDESRWKQRAQEIEKKMHFHREAYELALTFANTVAMMTEQPCFYDVGHRIESANRLELLKGNFEEQKVNLCRWYGYSTGQRSNIMNRRWHSGGIVATYDY